MIPVEICDSHHDQPVPLHNRWHPDIPAVKVVSPKAMFRIECLDRTGGQIKNNDSVNDTRDADLTKCII